MKETYRKTIASALAMTVVAAGAFLSHKAEAAILRSPTGVTWDCLINGSQGAGVAYITFYDDFSFDGLSIMTPNRPIPLPSDEDDNPRGGGDTGRGNEGSDSTPTIITATQNIYGFGPIEGQWNFDERGRVVGFFHQIVGGAGDTNSASTNLIGFRAIVVPSKRLTLTAFTPGNGRSVFRGMPMRTLPDLSGAWYGLHISRTERLVEFFDLAPSFLYGAYNGFGTGAAYETEGWVILSGRGRIGMATIANGGKIRATVGSFNRRTGRALTTGIIEPGQRVKFNAYHYPVIVD